jgi:hypothetical protein
MELRVSPVTFPEVIEFNFEELKTDIEARVERYTNLVYTEDQIKEAKTDLASLRKFTKALSDERIKVKKECLKPYEDFEAKIKELSAIVDKGIVNIDNQVKNYDEAKKEEKRAAIVELFEMIGHPEWLTLEQIFNERWLNASVRMSVVQNEIDVRLTEISKDLDTLSNLPEFAFEAEEEYKRSLDLNKAISEGKRLSEIAKRKAEMEADLAKRKAEQEAAKLPEGTDLNEVKEPGTYVVTPSEPVTPEPVEKLEVCFRVFLTVEQAKELKAFFDTRCIEFEKI